MKHTKGPWENVGNMVVAKLQTVDGTFIYPTMAVLSNTTTSMRANASLITAAPEMLEALELSLTYLKVANNDNGLICDVAIETIQAVIKKAKGD